MRRGRVCKDEEKGPGLREVWVQSKSTRSHDWWQFANCLIPLWPMWECIFAKLNIACGSLFWLRNGINTCTCCSCLNFGIYLEVLLPNEFHVALHFCCEKALILALVPVIWSPEVLFSNEISWYFLVRPGTLLKQGVLFLEAAWFKQCKLVKPMHLGFQRLLA